MMLLELLYLGSRTFLKKKKVEEISFQAQVAFEEGEKGEAAK